MSSNTLKCSFEVTAGIIPKVPIADYTRVWNLTSEQLEHGHDLIVASKAASQYALSLHDPKILNWVNFLWIWY